MSQYWNKRQRGAGFTCRSFCTRIIVFKCGREGNKSHQAFEISLINNYAVRKDYTKFQMAPKSKLNGYHEYIKIGQIIIPTWLEKKHTLSHPESGSF